MDEPGSENNHDAKSLRGLAEDALLAGLGAVALTKDRADELVAVEDVHPLELGDGIVVEATEYLGIPIST